MKTKRPTSAFTDLSKLTKATRPASAKSRGKGNVHGSIKKIGRGLGYFGDDSDKIKYQEKKKDIE